MNCFMIGFFGKCDEEKFKRDFRSGFYGIEASMFADKNEVLKLKEMSQTKSFKWGAHYPLIRKNSRTRDPLFISLDKSERDEAFRAFEDESEYVAESGGEYILAHFPKPVLIDDTFDRTYWRFANDAEWMRIDDYPVEAMEENLYKMFSKLNGIAVSHGIRVVLENDAVASYLCEGDLLENLFQEFSNIRACLDIGRLHLQESIDSGFNGLALALKLAPYTGLIHLWNTSPVLNLSGGHLPVSRAQSKLDGFADISKYLQVVCSQNEDIKILFEHRSDLLTHEELEDCYSYVQGIIDNCRS